MIMDRLDAMRLAVAVADAGSLSAASRQLRIPLATVSRNVTELEQNLSTRLFVRTGRRLSVTEAGARYLTDARRLLDEIRAIERAAAGEFSAPKGELIIGAPLVLGRLHVLPVVTAFLAQHAAVDVQLRLSDRVVSLADEQLDVAVRVGELPDSRLVSTKVGVIRRVTCASPAYLKRRGEPREPAHLTVHDCVTFQGFSSTRMWTFHSGRRQYRVNIHSRLVVNTAEAAIDATIAGSGITQVLSYQCAAALRSGALVPVLAAYEPRAQPVSLLYTATPLVPLKLRVFLDFAASRLRAALAEPAR